MKNDLHLPAINPSVQTDLISKFITDTFHQNQKDTAVIGLSGGIDSATTLFLVSQALTPEQIHVIILPSLQSSTTNANDAHTLADLLHIPQNQIHEINLSGIQTAYLQTLKLYTDNSDQLTDRRLGNLAARIRMSIIYDQAHTLNALVVGTENLSEHLLGYYTRFGDEASDLEPLRHLFKTQVIALAAHLKVPQHIIKKAPSADLWTGQTDEDELGFSYMEADPILYQHFTKNKSKDEIVSIGFPSDLVELVFKHLQQVNFKTKVPYLI